MTRTGFLSQLKSGLTSAPRLPQAWQINRGLNVGEPEIVGPVIGHEGDRGYNAVKLMK
jgi:hypothetical protein